MKAAKSQLESVESAAATQTTTAKAKADEVEKSFRVKLAEVEKTSSSSSTVISALEKKIKELQDQLLKEKKKQVDALSILDAPDVQYFLQMRDASHRGIASIQETLNAYI